MSDIRLQDKLRYLFGDASWKTRLSTGMSMVCGRLNTRVAPTGPWMLQLEVTNRCNMNCIMCSRAITEMQLGDMSSELIAKCVALSENTQETALFGYGEPLMSSAFFTLLGNLRSSRIGFFTNAQLLGPKMIARIAEAAARPISYIVISMDGACPETYEGIRQGASFNRVWDNIRNLVRYRNEHSLKTSVRLEFVAMVRNIRELPDLVELADAAGVDGIKVSHLVVWDESLREESLLGHQVLTGEIFAEAARRAASRRIMLDLPKIIRLDARSAPDAYPRCQAPWQYAMISFEGDVRACCFAPQFTFGNLRDESFRSIWGSDRYRNLRATLHTHDAPRPCLTCEERFRLAPSPDEARTYIKLDPRKK